MLDDLSLLENTDSIELFEPKLTQEVKSSTIPNPDMENVKMFLFARWIATCYADEHLDNNMKSEYEEGYNRDNELSVLNRETGYWYKEQLDHFNNVVYPNYIENGTVENTKRFFKI